MSSQLVWILMALAGTLIGLFGRALGFEDAMLLALAGNVASIVCQVFEDLTIPKRG